MSLAATKRALRAAIAASQPDGTYDDAGYDRIHKLIGELVPQTPTPRPIDRQDVVAGPWRSLFAQYGMRHSAGKPLEHLTTMNLMSFNRFPKAAVRLDHVDQEIAIAHAHYNNVQEVATPDGAHPARMIMWGRYAIEADAPQRYKVEFYAVELQPLGGLSDAAFREAFALPADQPLRIETKPPKLHSDVVYCDEDMRINFGSMGGVYVLERLAEPGRTIPS